jgi:(2Fe-2S) ferredoxin
MSYYVRHIFCCENKREPSHARGCCAEKDSPSLREYFKKRVKELGIEKTRVNSAGCLDRCELGPVIVIYPEGIWYRPTSEADIDRIISEHLQGGIPVEALRLKDEQKRLDSSL